VEPRTDAIVEMRRIIDEREQRGGGALLLKLRAGQSLADAAASKRRGRRPAGHPSTCTDDT
jgi:hypothetical protein